MNAGDSPAGRIIARDDEGMAVAMRRMQKSLQTLAPGEGMIDFVARAPVMIREHVLAIVDLVEGADAFDVIELMRMHEMPFALEGYRESLADGRPAAIDLVATVLLCREQRVAATAAQGGGRVAAHVPELHERAGTLLAIGQYALLADGLEDRYGPLTTLAATFVGHDLNVRVRQYLHIAREVDKELFGSQHLGTVLSETMGFGYEDFVAVRDSIATVLNRRFVDQAEAFEQVVREWNANGRSTQSSERIEQGRRALDAMMMHPGQRAAFRAQEISAESSVDVERVERVLDRFSVPISGPRDPVAAVEAFLAGRNPFRHAALLRDAEQNFAMLNVPIGTDSFRQVAEEALKKDARAWRRYERRRAMVSEQLVAAHLTSILQTGPAHLNLKYLRPNDGVEASSLDREASELTAISEQTEADALFIVEDVAICVEVKARSFSSQARSGNVQRLSGDLRATVMDATHQALRLETLIRENHGVWLEDRSWLDLSGVREVRSIAVCLDDLGPVGIALDELVKAGVVTSERFPWIVSLHDLAVIAEIVVRPAEFLLYLRRRTESEVSLLFSAVDELDLFMLFLSGQLYVEPDPDRVRQEFLGVPRPTGGERRRRLASAVPTRVMTHTDELDAWIYHRYGESEMPAPKPTFVSTGPMLKLVDFLLDGTKPGWFRFSADLLNLADEGQEKVTRCIRELVEQTRRDGQGHTGFVGFAGAWGYPTLFVGVQPPTMSHAAASNRLLTYAIAKKHQIRSDRSLIILLDSRGEYRSVRYANGMIESDADLDELVSALRLQSPEAMARPVPPSARRATKRLNPRKKPKKRR